MAQLSNKPVSIRVESRCFDELEDGDILEIAHVVLSGRGSDIDIDTLTRFGWWNDVSIEFISTLIFNFCLAKKSHALPGVELKTLKTKKTPEENAEAVIIAGFKSMEKSDFGCLIDNRKIPVENSLSYSWAMRAMASFSNAFLRSQGSSTGTGQVDYYLNGYADTAIEFIRDATTSSRVNHDLQILTPI